MKKQDLGMAPKLQKDIERAINSLSQEVYVFITNMEPKSSEYLDKHMKELEKLNEGDEINLSAYDVIMKQVSNLTTLSTILLKCINDPVICDRVTEVASIEYMKDDADNLSENEMNLMLDMMIKNKDNKPN